MDIKSTNSWQYVKGLPYYILDLEIEENELNIYYIKPIDYTTKANTKREKIYKELKAFDRISVPEGVEINGVELKQCKNCEKHDECSNRPIREALRLRSMCNIYDISMSELIIYEKIRRKKSSKKPYPPKSYVSPDKRLELAYIHHRDLGNIPQEFMDKDLIIENIEISVMGKLEEINSLKLNFLKYTKTNELGHKFKLPNVSGSVDHKVDICVGEEKRTIHINNLSVINFGDVLNKRSGEEVKEGSSKGHSNSTIMMSYEDRERNSEYKIECTKGLDGKLRKEPYIHICGNREGTSVMNASGKLGDEIEFEVLGVVDYVDCEFQWEII